MGIIGGVVVAILILASAWVLQKKGACGKQFDERQREARSRGQRYGFLVLVLCNLLYGTALLSGVKLPVDSAVVIFCGLIVALTAQVCYNIWNDAYFTLRDNKKKVMTGVGLIAVSDALNTWSLFRRGDRFFQVYALLAGALIVMFGVMVLRQTAEGRNRA